MPSASRAKPAARAGKKAAGPASPRGALRAKGEVPGGETAAKELRALLGVMDCLRDPERGCPWDREQTHESIRGSLLEEAYEAIDAIDEKDAAHLKEELGDVLLQTVFHAQLAQEAGAFDFAEVLHALREKLLRRHPHVFGEVEVRGTDDVLRNWETIKAGEKGGREVRRILSGVPKSAPPLARARMLQKRAARVGFDWPDAAGAVEKIAEEAGEVASALKGGQTAAVEEELGDLLFSVVNVCRKAHVDPSLALTKANKKFEKRFGKVEDALRAAGKTWKDASLEEMDRAWNAAKGSR